MRAFRQLIRTWAGTPSYATVTTVLAAIAGLFGSVYGNEIGSSFPLSLGPYQGVSFKAVAFWLTLVLFGIMFFERQRYDDAARERLETTSANIKTLVETLPPKAFRSQYARQSHSSWNALATVAPRHLGSDVTAEKFAGFIRSLLQSIATLAFVYDDQPSASYAANVMLFEEPSTSAEAFTQNVLSALKFIPADIDLHQLRGVLLLRSDLSATTAKASPDVDETVPVIALPVPKDPKHGARWALLPGAPIAFVTGEIDGYADSRTLVSWCVEKGDFAPSVVDAVAQYFEQGAGKDIRSFISRPLFSDDGRPIGVLNLHADRTNILGPATDRREIFQAVVTPLFLELGRAVSMLVELEKPPAKHA